jgi:hypothetical protein
LASIHGSSPACGDDGSTEGSPSVRCNTFFKPTPHGRARSATGLTSGVIISGQAAVVFDTNAPIQTQTVRNTIDAATPASSVNPLSATEPATTFTISWSGSDLNGPGIASYTVYVSDNGWLARVALGILVRMMDADLRFLPLPFLPSNASHSFLI